MKFIKNWKTKLKTEFNARVKEKINMSLGQAMSETASEYGYEINPEDMEKIFVKTQTLDEKELAAVTGGNEEDDSDYGMPDNDPYEV